MSTPKGEMLVVGTTMDVPVEISNATGGSDLTWSAQVMLSEVSLGVTPFSGPVNDQAEARRPASSEGQSFSLVNEAPWDLQYSWNLETVTGALGNAGAEWDGAYAYSTEKPAAEFVSRVFMRDRSVLQIHVKDPSPIPLARFRHVLRHSVPPTHF